MAQSVYQRAAGRGFPVYDVSGQSGQGRLQDATAPPGRAGLPSASWTDPEQDPGSVPATLTLPEVYVLGGSLYGLPGALNPDNTPRTHAAPFADPTIPRGDYYAEAEAAHAGVFTGVAERQPVTNGVMRERREGGQGSTADTLEHVTGQLRSNAGFDAVQGYGGGGPGPGGVNDPQGPATDLTVWRGETYTNVFVSAREVPLLVADADQFIATAPELPPYVAMYDGGDVAVHAQDTPAADVPAQGPALAGAPAGLPAYVTSFWG